MVGVDPNIRDIVIEDLSDLINYPRRQLRRHFGRRNPASHPLDLPLIYHGHCVELAAEALLQRHFAAPERCIAPLAHFEVELSATNVLQQRIHDPAEGLNALINRVVCVSVQLQVKLTFTEYRKDADQLQPVRAGPLELAHMLDWQPIVTVDNAWFEDEFGARLSHVHLTAIGDFLDQLEQVEFELLETWVCLLAPDILDDDLSTGKAG